MIKENDWFTVEPKRRGDTWYYGAFEVKWVTWSYTGCYIYAKIGGEVVSFRPNEVVRWPDDLAMPA